jgi:ribosomal protein S6--L-glutamate ligase
MRIGILSAELGQEDIHENKRLIREIRLRGHKALVVNYRKTVVVATKNRRLLYQPDKKGQLHPVKLDAVIPRINEADEQSINLATFALESLISNGVFSTATPEAIRLAKNKIGSLMALAQASIPVPRSAAITGTDSYEIDIDKVLKIVEPQPNKRLIIKTNTGTHGKGVMSAKTRGEARAIAQGFLSNGIPILIQQFMEPLKRNQYTDIRLIVINGRVAGAMERVSSGKDEIRANLSLGGRGRPYLPSEAEKELAEKAAKAIGLSVAGVDLLPSGSRRVIIEVNTSPGFIIEEISGVNIAKKIVQLAIVCALRGEKTRRQKLADKLNQPISLPPARVRLSPKIQFKKLGGNLSGHRTKPPANRAK